MRPLIGDAHAEPFEHTIGIFTPGGGDGCSGNGVFEDEVPTDNPGDEFAHGCVGICIGTAGDRNHGGEFRVTETGKGAPDAGQDEC